MFDQKIFDNKMKITLDRLSKELASLSTGRANSKILDLIKVDVYGQKCQLIN